MSRQRREPAPGGAEPSSGRASPRRSVAPQKPRITGGTEPEVARPATSEVATPGAAEQAPTATSHSTDKDVLYVHSACESGNGYNVVRRRGDRLEVGLVSAPREGQPIYGELVRLSPRKESERLFDVDVILAPPSAASHKGPAQVATDRYRRNWDAIFGARAAKPDGGEAPN